MRAPQAESCQPVYHQNKQEPHQATFKIPGPLINNLPNLKAMKKKCPAGAVQLLQLWPARPGQSPGTDCPGVPSDQRQATTACLGEAGQEKREIKNLKNAFT